MTSVRRGRAAATGVGRVTAASQRGSPTARSGASSRSAWSRCCRPGAPADNTRSFLFDTCSSSRPPRAVYGRRPQPSPDAAGVWQLFAVGLVLFAAGDVIFDVAVRGFGAARRLPLRRHPLPRRVPGARGRAGPTRRARATTARTADRQRASSRSRCPPSSGNGSSRRCSTARPGATVERIVTVAYPLMDILLVVVIVHAVFTLPRWTPRRVVPASPASP